MKLFIVTSGDYSDKCNRGIYSTRELAVEANKHVGNWNEIEEFELDEMPSGSKPGLFLFKIIMRPNGDVIGKYLQDQKVDPRYPDSISAAKDSANFNVEAKDEEHAIKIANDRRRQMIAEGRL